MFYLVPPAGTPLTIGDIIKIKFTWLFSTRARAKFLGQLKEHTGLDKIFLVNSGRTAQTIILKALREMVQDDRDEVIIPAYTCFSVPASVVRAGLKVRLVDIDPATMDYNYDNLVQTDFSRVLVVNASNLFGLVSNWYELNRIASEKKILMIDDAAQTLGSDYDGKVSGTLGEAGFYSLDRGKNMTTFSGGVLMTADEKLGQLIEKQISELPQPGIVSGVSTIIKLVLYMFMLKPWLYWLPNSLPFLKLGETVYDPQFEMSQLGRAQVSAGAVLFKKLYKVNETRQNNAKRLAEKIAASRKYQIPGYNADHCPIYLRLPLLTKNAQERETLIKRLENFGIKASTMYPAPINEIPELGGNLVNGGENFPGAKEVAERLLTLPVHPYVKERDIERMLTCLKI